MPARDERLDDLQARAAELAHDCWAFSLAAQGWRRGSHDPASKTHDALVPFAELSCRDKRSAMIAVRAEEVVRHLGEIIDYERGPDREFLLEDVAEDLPVESQGRRGRIIGWSSDEGELTAITVRFEDGEELSFDPVDRLLNRVEEA